MSGIAKLLTAGGGGVSLTPASSIASDVTVNVPSQNCTLDIQGPAFSAYQSNPNQSIASATFTKVQLNTEEFDTANCFDPSTNYRFTPNVAGYYQINAQLHYSASVAARTTLFVYKNGSIYKSGSGNVQNGTNSVGPSCACLVYMNGSTDYIELYAWVGTATTLTYQGSISDSCYMSGALVRAA